MQILENNQEIVFTYQFQSGPANKSYGVHVAKMAGLPQSVVEQAQMMLQGFKEHGLQFILKLFKINY